MISNLKNKLVLLLCLCINLSFADDLSIENKLANFPTTFNSVKEFSSIIKTSFRTDEDRIKATYLWLSKNIAYDFYEAKTAQNYKRKVSATSEKALNYKIKQIQLNYANLSLRKKKAVCEGYAQIFRFAMDYLGIKNELVYGNTKRTFKDIGRVKYKTDHVWNTFFYNNTWYMVDITWSAGFVDSKNGKFIFNFNKNYFCPDPEQLILTHYPEEKKWQQLEQPISKEEFYNQPFIHSNYFKSDLKVNLLEKGVIKAYRNEEIVIQFNSIDESKTYHYEFKGDEYSSELKFFKSNGKYFTTITIPATYRTNVLTIFDENAVLKFKVLVD